MERWRIQHGPEGQWSVVHTPDTEPERKHALPDEMDRPKEPSKPDELRKPAPSWARRLS